MARTPNFKPPSYGCAGYVVDTPNGRDYECAYDTKITCDECKFNNPPGRKDPTAKRNKLSE